MRTTLDLPDPLFRELKAKAARNGQTLKELLTSIVENDLHPGQTETPVRSPLPVFRKATGIPLRALTNAEIEEIFIQEDIERSK